MAEENVEKSEEKEPSSSESVDLFSKMSEITPLRDVELEDEDLDKGDGEHETLEERIDSGRKLTDFQTLSLILNPDFGYKHLNLLAKGRTFPDSFSPLDIIMENDLIKRGVPVPEAIAIVYTVLTKSIDGEGIIDNIVAYTKGHATEIEENNKGAGLP